MYPKFIKLYTFLKKNGVLVTLFTNLSLLNDDILTVLKKYKPFNVDVTLYGFNQQVFESITNAKNIDCKSILKNIKLLKTNVINVSSNICDFDVIKEWCKKENINFRYSSDLFSKYNGDFPIEYQINNNDIYYQKYKEKTLTKNNIKINFSCSVSKYSLFLEYDLKIRPCWKFYKVDDFMISVSDKNIISSINSLQEKIGLYYGKVLKGCKGCFAYSICNECIVNELVDKNYNIKNSCKKI